MCMAKLSHVDRKGGVVMSIGSIWISRDGFRLVLVRRINDQLFDYAQLNGTHNGSISIECLNKRFTRWGAQA